jgi:hypothetical protein
MPELHHILGSIFRDIAQSVFTSDMYSRDISRYYEQDPLLRHFPVPRTEVDELEVQLKFAIANIDLNPAQSVSRESSAATVFVDFSYDLSEQFFETLASHLEGEEKVAGDTWRKVNSLEQRIYLRQDLLKYFLREQGSLIDAQGEFQVNEARREIGGLLNQRVEWLLKDTPLAAGTLKKIADTTIKSLKLDIQLKELVEPLRFAWEQGGDFTLNVEITADKLQGMDPAQLSTVHVRTRMRNYLWSEVEHEGRRWWTLNPE